LDGTASGDWVWGYWLYVCICVNGRSLYPALGTQSNGLDALCFRFYLAHLCGWVAAGSAGDRDGDNGRFLLAAVVVCVAETVLLVPHPVRGGVCSCIGRERFIDGFVLIIGIGNKHDFVASYEWQVATDYLSLAT
jgi:hypothetical protein